ncbi:MAG: UPF0236 family protein [Coriobacteriales bacterium]|jgi:hypothetical protein|nr:UPF0236 family protein [Coriobacteriales bacterium]
MDDTTFCVDALSELFYKNLLETEDFGKHVEYCEVTGRLIIRAAFIKNLVRFDDELLSEVPKGWRLCGSRKRTVITMLGEISYTRRIYTDEFGCRRYPLDEVLGVASHQHLDKDAFLWIVRCAADVSYEKTAKAFNDRTGTSITRQTVMRCVHRCGELLAKGGGVGTDLPISAETLFCEFDGFWVNLQSKTKQPAQDRLTYKAQFRKKSAEMKVWVVYAGKSRKHPNRRIAPFHWASDGGAEEFFSECAKRTSAVYDLTYADWVLTASDAAGWCKAHGLDAYVRKDAVIISRLDTYHVNQKVYKAFSSEEDRGTYLDYLYRKDFDGFLAALSERMDAEPKDERDERRRELYDYISNNLDWLKGASLSRYIREMLLKDLVRVFGDRRFCAHLCELLSKHKYKRLLQELKIIASACTKGHRLTYRGFLEDAKEAIRLIKTYGPVTLGTMEGTNSKVYAARLKVWGCAWSVRGAVAMMRIRATLASGLKLVAPSYDSRFTDKEKSCMEAYRHRSFAVPQSVGVGFEPPQGSVVLTTLMPPAMQALLRH